MAGLVIALGAAGLLFGSFANVVIHRVPRTQSILHPPSHCVSCDTPIRARDNIPVLSWALLRGRCRHCGAHISARYPVIELLTAAVFVLTAWRLPEQSDLIAYIPLAWLLVVLSAIDIEHKIVPNRIVLPATVVTAALLAITAVLGPGVEALIRALLASGASFGGFLVLALIAPKGMGMGDVKLAALLGMALGYFGWTQVFVGFFTSFAAGAIGGLTLVAAKRAGLKSEVPFGPWLALGTLIGIWWGTAIGDAWLNRV